MEEILKIMDNKKFQELKMIGKGKNDLLFKLLEKYEETSSVYIQSIRKTYQENNIPKLLREIHALKGATATLALTDIRELVENLEKELKNGNIENVTDVMEKVELKIKEIKKIKNTLL